MMTCITALCRATERRMAWLILAVALLAYFYPACGLLIESAWISPLLTAVMFGMGLTLKPADFKNIVLNPRPVLLGCAAQFTLMPLLAWLLCHIFRPDPALVAGVILVGTCPGGTASNVITFIAKGDLALSVGMTTLNTLLAPLLTPFITWLLLHTTVEVEPLAMLLSIVQIVIIPIAAGLLLNRCFPRLMQRALPYLPAFSIAAICIIIACVISHNAAQIAAAGLSVLAIVICHNLLGFAGGFGMAKALKLPPAQSKALAIEIGMQNSGLAVALAHTAFPTLPLAAVPGALFSVWHNISGGMLAHIFQSKK